MDCSKYLKVKNIASYFNSLPDAFKYNRLLTAYLLHSTAERKDLDAGEKEKSNIAMDVVKGIGKGVTGVASTVLNLGMSGLNFMLPQNLFWQSIFCVMACSKSYVSLNC